MVRLPRTLANQTHNRRFRRVCQSAVTIIGIVAVGFLGVPHSDAAPPRCDINEIAYVVERLDVGKKIHLDWAASPQDNPRLEIAGDRAWHLRWASDYDRTVELIKSLALRAC